MQLLELSDAAQNRGLIQPVVWRAIDGLISVLIAVLGYNY